jgi:hypothetical protein
MGYASCVFSYLGTIVSDEPLASIFIEEEIHSSTLKMEAVSSSETIVTTY